MTIDSGRWLKVLRSIDKERVEMIINLRRRLRKNAPAESTLSGDPAIPAGRRVYAVGDVHGCSDLFVRLTEAIDRDDAARGDADTTCVLLGDLVDRGPDSAGVIDHAMRWSQQRDVRLIAANHEEMFLTALEDIDAFRHFLRIGGLETIASYGVDRQAFDCASYAKAQAMARAVVPDAHRAFLGAAENQLRIGDYLFAHAGIRPGVELDAQSEGDLRWIREPFLGSDADHGCVVVHGHTITDDPHVRHNRIGIDTGAYRTGRLTALGLEGTQRWLIEARTDAGDSIAVTQRPA